MRARIWMARALAREHLAVPHAPSLSGAFTMTICTTPWGLAMVWWARAASAQSSRAAVVVEGLSGIDNQVCGVHAVHMVDRRVPGAQKEERLWVCPQNETVKGRGSRPPTCPAHAGEAMVAPRPKS